MHFVIPHKFTKTEAVSRIKNMLAEAKPQLAGKATIDKEEWNGNTLAFAFTAEGQKIAGQCEVQDNQFVVDAKLPFMLRLFEGRIQKAIEEQTREMLK